MKSREKPAKAWVFALGAIFIALVMTGLGLTRSRTIVGRGEHAEGEVPKGQFAGAYSALCTSRAVVESDLDAARDIFFTRAHADLHVVAAEVAGRDRKLAAEFLESKNQVEQALGAGDREAAASALDRLLSVGKQALISLGMTSPSCREDAARP